MFVCAADVKGVFVVEAEAAAQFMQDVAKSNKAEAGLQLLSAMLQQPNAGSDTIAATEANVLQVCILDFSVTVFCQACIHSMNCCNQGQCLGGLHSHLAA